MKFPSQIIIQFRVKFLFWLHSIDQKNLVFVRSKLEEKINAINRWQNSVFSINNYANSKQIRARKKLVISKNRCPWVNKENKNLLKKRDQARKKLVLSDEPTNRDKYVSLRNEITSKIRKSKRAYFSRSTDQRNSRTIFDTLKF